MGEFKPTWSKMANVDQFVWLTRVDMLEQLRMAREELGIEYVRACGMLDDKMRTWGRDPRDFRKPPKERPYRLNFQIVDMVFDRLLEMGIKPLYTTCFTPSAMAAGTCEIWQHTRTSPPKDIQLWKDYIRKGIEHEIALRGREEVASWYFEVWNEPNLKGCFFDGTQEEWFQLWAATFDAIKAACPEARVGGPSTARGEWIDTFLDWTQEHGCPPDYIITHVYNNDSESAPLSPFDGPASMRVKDSPHFASGVIRGVAKLLQSRGFPGEIHWNEWGRSWFPYDPLKETPLEAAFVVKTMAEVSHLADIFAFWCISDIYDQMGYASEEFSGNYGLLSLHGLRKPAYFAHALLNLAVGKRVEVPSPDPEGLEGAVATRRARECSVLLYRYPQKIEEETQTDPVEVLLPKDAHQLRLYRIDRTENNILAAWRAMGSPAYLGPSERRELRAMNELRFTFTDIEPTSSPEGLWARFSLEKPGVALLRCQLGGGEA